MAPLKVDRVLQLLETRSKGWRLRYSRSCESTQELARAALAEGEGEHLALVTDFQRAGRGRHGKSWVAPAEQALLFTAVLRVDPPPATLIPLAAGVALAEAVEAASGVRVDLKWPNDLQVGAAKLGGILVERPPGGCALVGIGINVSQRESDLPLGIPATSLAHVSPGVVDREALLAEVLVRLERTWDRLLEQGAGWVRTAWKERSTMLGRPVELATAGRPTRTGVAEDLSPDGALIVRLADGRLETVVAGEVRVRSAGSAPDRDRAHHL